MNKNLQKILILAISLNFQQNYFDQQWVNKIIFRSVKFSVKFFILQQDYSVCAVLQLLQCNIIQFL